MQISKELSIKRKWDRNNLVPRPQPSRTRPKKRKKVKKKWKKNVKINTLSITRKLGYHRWDPEKKQKEKKRKGNRKTRQIFKGV